MSSIKKRNGHGSIELKNVDIKYLERNELDQRFERRRKTNRLSLNFDQSQQNKLIFPNLYNNDKKGMTSIE